MASRWEWACRLATLNETLRPSPPSNIALLATLGRLATLEEGAPGGLVGATACLSIPTFFAACRNRWRPVAGPSRLRLFRSERSIFRWDLAATKALSLRLVPTVRMLAGCGAVAARPSDSSACAAPRTAAAPDAVEARASFGLPAPPLT